MMTRKIQFALLLAVVCFGLTQAASGIAIGQLTINPCSGGGVTVTWNSITYLPASGANQGCITTGSGTLVTFTGVGGGALGVGVNAVVNGTIQNSPGGNPATYMQFPVTGGSGTETLVFQLLSVGPGAGTTNCAGLGIGQSCSPFTGSPFILTNLGPGGTLIALSVGGTIVENGGTNSWTGALTAQVNQTAAQIQGIICPNNDPQNNCTGGTSLTNTYSGSFVLSPEPSSLSLMLGGGLLCAVGLIRRRRKLAA